MFDVETLKFIDLLNTLAKTSEDGIHPFSNLISVYQKSGGSSDFFFFYFIKMQCKTVDKIW